MITVSKLANGAIEERLNNAIADVLINIIDSNTDWKKKRKVNLVITLQPREDRELANVDFDVKVTLAPVKTVQTALLIDIDGDGCPVAVEYGKQAKGQTFINDSSNIVTLEPTKL